mgnify:CR=1 FL=1
MKIKNLLKPDNWWILILSGVIAYMVYVIFSNPEYNKFCLQNPIHHPFAGHNETILHDE